MEYKKLSDTYVLRLAIGEEIVESVAALCQKEKIVAACITGIGAIKGATLCVYNVDTGIYHDRECEEFAELTALVGNASIKDDKPYIHLHATVATESGQVLGGHLKKAVIGATAEIFLRTFSQPLGRFYDEESKLNLLAF